MQWRGMLAAECGLAGGRIGLGTNGPREMRALKETGVRSWELAMLGIGGTGIGGARSWRRSGLGQMGLEARELETLGIGDTGFGTDGI